MTHETLAAHTYPNSPYPSFFNVSLQDSGCIHVSIRSAAKEDGSEGVQATFEGPDYLVRKLLIEAVEQLDARKNKVI